MTLQLTVAETLLSLFIVLLTHGVQIHINIPLKMAKTLNINKFVRLQDVIVPILSNEKVCKIFNC